MKSILDPAFRYTNSVETDLAKTFARIRREQRQASQGQGKATAKVKDNVQAFVPRKRALG
jgi:hypothetical protein